MVPSCSSVPSRLTIREVTISETLQPKLSVGIDAVATSPGGGLSFLLEQLHALQTLEVRLVIFTTSRSASSFRIALPSAEIIQLPDWVGPLRILFQLTILPILARHLYCDVYYCPGSFGPLVSRVPVVICVQNPHLFTRNSPRAFRISVQRAVSWLSALRAEAIIHISESMLHAYNIHTQLETPSHLIYSSPPQHRLDFRDSRSTSSSSAITARFRRFALMVNNLYPYKRVDLAIASLAMLPDSDADLGLVIAGQSLEQKYLKMLDSLAQDLGVAARVMFLGFCDDNDLVWLYRNASVVVSCSEREAHPLTPMEALEANQNLVLSDIPSHRELYDGVSIFFPPGSATGCADALRLALATPRVNRWPISDTCRPTWQEHANALYRVFDDCRTRNPSSHAFKFSRWRHRRPLHLLREFIGTGQPYRSESTLLSQYAPPLRSIRRLRSRNRE